MMNDDLQKKYRDKTLISLTEKGENEEWVEVLNTTPSRLKDAIEAVGDNRADVEEWLSKNGRH